MKHSSSRWDGFWLMLTLTVILTCSILIDDYQNPRNQLHRVFGVSCMTLNNPFYEVINEGLRKAVESQGDSLLILDPMLDAAKQSEQIERMIEEEVDGIFINPIDSAAIAGSLTKAKMNHIPVVVFDCPAVPENLAGTTVVSDNQKAGVLIAHDLMDRKEKAQILLLEHSSAQSGFERIRSFLNTIEDHPQYVITDRLECEGQLEKAMPLVYASLLAHPEIDVIVALNDPSALGADAAAAILNRNDLCIYGVDGTPDFKKKMAESLNLTGTVVQSPRTIARRAAQQMYTLLDHRKTDALYLHGSRNRPSASGFTLINEQGSDFSEGELIIDVRLLKREDLASYDKMGWE